MFNFIIDFAREYYRTNNFIPLHAPIFRGKERDYVSDTINSTFVSSVGAYVDRFEHDIEKYTGSVRAVATVNGTAACHIALLLAGVKANDYVLTQTVTFVATCNAIAYCNAAPIFIDVDRSRLSLSPAAMDAWLIENARVDVEGFCRHKETDRIIRACFPMHTFGHPADLEALLMVCKKWHLVLIEDAAESLGSFYKEKHTGTFGKLGALSFNGNKIITTGGGGMILTDRETGDKAKHITTTAKKNHPYEFYHDELGYNYRLPNLNAALGCAQLEQIEHFISKKRELAKQYQELFKHSHLQFVTEPKDSRSNYWLNAVICENEEERDKLLHETNEHGVMTRPIWQLMHKLPLYSGALRGDLSISEWLAARVVNIPSSVFLE